MADYYTEYSFIAMFPIEAKPLIDFILNHGDLLYEFAINDSVADHLINYLAENTTGVPNSLLETVEDIMMHNPWYDIDFAGFGEHMEIDTVNKHSFTVWFHDWEGGPLSFITTLVGDILKNYNAGLEYAVIVNWASTCSKPRTDSFSGGACLITAEEIYDFNPSAQAIEKLHELKSTIDSEMRHHL
jgi:hypothetical protein